MNIMFDHCIWCDIHPVDPCYIHIKGGGSWDFKALLSIGKDIDWLKWSYVILWLFLLVLMCLVIICLPGAKTIAIVYLCLWYVSSYMCQPVSNYHWLSLVPLVTRIVSDGYLDWESQLPCIPISWESQLICLPHPCSGSLAWHSLWHTPFYGLL